ncbi:nucleoid-associated protein YejK [Paraglaciecola sp. L1A13]|uniref:nucleoid-associated protein YejK n=1 Tax=Paraglaciecola sp. L1A13 TaxID=2686359 RepID=UPI00131EC85B|nr:nucleoid-associated protein YejK [Paraglaciecola sp. L1A13]
MSALIRHFVVHQLAINDQQQLTLVPRNSCFSVSPEIEDLAQQINHAFNTKPGKGVGGFVEQGAETIQDGENEVVPVSPFQDKLKVMLDDPEQFVHFSIQSSEMLKKTMTDMASIETGFVVFSHYEFLATEYLMIAILNTKQHVEINRDLELSSSDHLDLAKMQLAVRIDLTQLSTTPEQNRYVSFIKGRMGRKVSDFFMHFLGCEELVDIKQQNKQLLSSVDDYLAAEQMDATEKQATRKTVSEYYKEKLDAGEDIQLKELADKLPKEPDGDDFYQFVANSESPIEETFQADRSVLKTLAKFSGQGGGISLSFERNLYGERVHYDAGSDTLMIKGIPPNLKDQLLKAQK